ncbi:MAG: hypothetical protein ACOYJ8_03345, partial [Patescibacteria group bacterium]
MKKIKSILNKLFWATIVLFFLTSLTHILCPAFNIKQESTKAFFFSVFILNIILSIACYLTSPKKVISDWLKTMNFIRGRTNLLPYKTKKVIHLLQNYFEKRWIKWGIIPSLLFALGVGLMFSNIMTAKDSFTVLGYDTPVSCQINTQEIDKSTWESFQPEKQVQNNFPYQTTILCQFNAPADNLGSIAIKFNRLDETNLDQQLTFATKQTNSKDWHYINQYNMNQIFENKYYPFGFPTIENSENKQYIVLLTIPQAEKTPV